MRPSCLFSFWATAGFVAGSPLLRSRAVQYKRDSNITSENLLNFKFYAQWAGSAYCNDDSQQGQSVVCSGDVCPELQSHNASIIGSFNDNTVMGMEGFVGIDPVRAETVLAFRGTHSVRNWLADLDFDTDACSDDLPVGGDSDCAVHSGFNAAWHEVKDDVYAFLATARQAHPNHALVVTGHSLGAAVGTLAAAQLRADGFPCTLYTFGSPRVGNQAFVDFVQAQEGDEFRITHYDDPVPRMPPSWGVIGAFRHLSPEYWLTVENWTDLSPSVVNASNFAICVGSDNDACNAGTSGMDIAAHRWYFRNISSCSPDMTL